MSYIPPAGNQISIGFGSGYAPPAGNQISASLDAFLLPISTGLELPAPLCALTTVPCSVDCPTVTSAETVGMVINTLIIDAALVAELVAVRADVIETTCMIRFSDPVRTGTSVLIVSRAAVSESSSCTIVAGEMQPLSADLTLFTALPSERLCQGAVIDADLAMTRVPVTASCVMIRLDGSGSSTVEEIAVSVGVVAGAVWQDGTPAPVGSYTEADVVAGRVVVVASAGLDPIAINLQWDRASFVITGTVELATAADYQACIIGSDIELTIGTDTIRLRVADRRRNRTIEAWTYTLDVQSPAAWLDSPWSAPIDGEWSGPASAIAAQLAAPVPVDWQTVDWSVPADLLIATGQTPLEIVRTLKDVAGAVIQSLPDGSLIVEPNYPVAVPDWRNTAPTYSVSVGAEVFRDDEQSDWRDGSTAFLVSSTSPGASAGDIRIDVVDQSDSSRLVRVVTVPWSNNISCTHRGGDWVSLALVGDIEREETETISIVDGAGRVAFPVQALVAWDWLETELGSVTAVESGEITSSMIGESLLSVTYRTRSREYLLSNPREEDVMVVAEAPDADALGAVSVLVSRDGGLKRGEDIVDPLLTDVAVGQERGRNAIDASYSPRKLVTLAIPYRGLWRPGRLVEVFDIDREPWIGQLQSQSVVYSMSNDGELTLDTSIVLECEDL